MFEKELELERIRKFLKSRFPDSSVINETAEIIYNHFNGTGTMGEGR